MTNPNEEMETVEGDGPLKFRCPEELYEAIPEPTPAREMMPDWYKELPPDHSHHLESPTAKRCAPFLDAMQTGWVVPLTADIWVETNENASEIKTHTKVDRDIMGDFAARQAGLSEDDDRSIIGKWKSEWIVETPDGWSMMITHPWNRNEYRWRTYTGVVDTDTDPIYLNAPFRWLEPNYEGLIKSGTPIAQVVPIKRDALLSEASVGPASEEERLDHVRYCHRQHTQHQPYRERNRQPKPQPKNVDDT